MAFDYDSNKPESKYVYLPKMGGRETYKIKTVRKVEGGNPRWNFSSDTKKTLKDEAGNPMDVIVKTDLGWHLECDLDNGKVLSVSSYPAYLKVFLHHKIQDGETVAIEHPEKGVWKVEKV